MYDQTKPLNAIAAIRVSTTKQGTEGDSPEAQREQIEQFAQSRNIKIKKIFSFLESASREQQPMQEAINYCKVRKNNVQLFIVKSIDRFTRLGSFTYSGLKSQLDNCDVRLMDIYGIIGAQKVNTLEHLGVSYKWSVYDPTKNSEILEAERASDEKRDIMSRMIGAQIRYTRLGYWMRRPLYGYTSEKVETRNGKRCMLIPHPTESLLIIKLFELRCRNTLNDQQITDEINKLRFRTRIHYLRSKQNRTIIIGQRGGNKFTTKELQRLVQSPVYAGINNEKWAGGVVVKLKSEGLVSIKTFNKANRGKITIRETVDGFKIHRKLSSQQIPHKGVDNPLYPYKRVVRCPFCELPLYGSASSGKSGTRYPAYHCSGGVRGQHYFRVPKKQFDETITQFLTNIQIEPQYTERVMRAVFAEQVRRRGERVRDGSVRTMQVSELKAQAKTLANNLKFVRSEAAIRYMEEDLLEIEEEIAIATADQLQAQGNKLDTHKTTRVFVAELLEDLNDLLVSNLSPASKSLYFGLLFNGAPTYNELLGATQDKTPLAKLNEIFQMR